MTVHEGVDVPAVVRLRQGGDPRRAVRGPDAGQLPQAVGMLPGIEEEQLFSGRGDHVFHRNPGRLQVVRGQGDAQSRAVIEFDEGLEGIERRQQATAVIFHGHVAVVLLGQFHLGLQRFQESLHLGGQVLGHARPQLAHGHAAARLAQQFRIPGIAVCAATVASERIELQLVPGQQFLQSLGAHFLDFVQMRALEVAGPEIDGLESQGRNPRTSILHRQGAELHRGGRQFHRPAWFGRAGRGCAEQGWGGQRRGSRRRGPQKIAACSRRRSQRFLRVHLQGILRENMLHNLPATFAVLGRVLKISPLPLGEGPGMRAAMPKSYKMNGL